MKLNTDCVRDVMLALESKLDLCEAHNSYQFVACGVDSICWSSLKGKYPETEVAYTVLQLAESGYIVTNSQSLCNKSLGLLDVGSVLYITPKGHEFIERIRDNDRWKTVKKGASAIRDYSLSALSSIAEGVTSAAISAYFSGQTNPQ